MALKEYCRKSAYYPVILFSAFFFCICIGHAFGESDKSNDLPLAVRLIFTKINPMLQDKNYAAAINTLKKFQSQAGTSSTAQTDDPNGYHHPEVYFTLGNCYLSAEQYASAIEAYRKVVARKPDYTSAWLNLAKAAYEFKQYTESAESFFKAYETSGNKNPEYLYYSAASYLIGEKYKPAIDVFNRLSASHPSVFKPEWREYLVHALLTTNQNKEALPHIQTLVREYSGEKKMQWQEILLSLYLQLETAPKALELVKSLANQAPHEDRWWKALAHIHLNTGNYQDALTALIIYSFLKPLSSDEEKLMADLYFQLGIPAKAAPIYEEFFSRKSNKQLLQQVTAAYMQSGQFEKALKHIDSSGFARQDIDFMLLKGELLYAMKKFDQAAEVYRRAALKKGTHSGQAWLMAGYAAWQVNDLKTSKDAFANASKYEHQQKAAIEALRQLNKIVSERK